ncbi:hypothetical protein M758_7G024800 [Ceratodon purpureus]|nr:hypothetical protein M758_7G024800 [Ceratodon purpureus]
MNLMLLQLKELVGRTARNIFRVSRSPSLSCY